MSKVLVRLKEEYGNYLAVGSPGVSSLVIKKGGEHDPAGFELDEDLYEKFRKYLVPVFGEDTKRRDLYFYGCDGFGDSFYQRALVRHLAKEYGTIYLRTAIPEVYWDIPNVKFLYPVLLI